MEAVLDGDGEAVQGPDGAAGAVQVGVELARALDGAVEQRFG